MKCMFTHTECLAEECYLFDYTKSKCKMAIKLELDIKNYKDQSVNSKKLEYDGKIYSQNQLAKVLGISPPTLAYRLKMTDGDVEKAINYHLD